jgi:hypothetical protein
VIAAIASSLEKKNVNCWLLIQPIMATAPNGRRITAAASHHCLGHRYLDAIIGVPLPVAS